MRLNIAKLRADARKAYLEDHVPYGTGSTGLHVDWSANSTVLSEDTSVLGACIIGAVMLGKPVRYSASSHATNNQDPIYDAFGMEYVEDDDLTQPAYGERKRITGEVWHGWDDAGISAQDGDFGIPTGQSEAYTEAWKLHHEIYRALNK